MKRNLPRRRFLVGSALAAGAFLVPGLQAGSLSAAVRLSDEDERIIAELAAYSVDVQPWAGPVDFVPPKRKTDPDTTRSTNFLVRVSDVGLLVRYLTSGNLQRLGVVYAGGPHLAFFAGSTAYLVTNYLPEDFYRATQ